MDEQDVTLVSQYKWHLLKGGYAATSIGGRKNKKMIYMHRLIISAKDGEFVDHLDHNKLNNIRSNLRICNQSQNGGNSRSTISNKKTSKYKGVYWDKSRNKWASRIKVNYIGKFLGRFDLEEDAAKAYNDAATIYFGEFACLNEI